jgi:hypothetical protein
MTMLVENKVDTLILSRRTSQTTDSHRPATLKEALVDEFIYRYSHYSPKDWDTEK